MGTVASYAGHPGQTASKPDVDPGRGSVKPTLYGMRRSCDACGHRKKKCDGARPCRRCVDLGEECTYTKRRWHLPQPQQDQQRQQQSRRGGVHPRQIHASPAEGTGLISMEAAATKGRGHAITNPDVIPTGGRVQPTLHGVRRSCDACGRQKKKCDGKRPCSRCARRGDGCSYSKRRCPQQHHQRQQQCHGGGSHLLQAPTTSAFGAPVARDILSFKRCRLSASPATGLVGMQENGFLSDFFGCVGFLPLTTQSHVRESMVKIMLTADPRQQCSFGGDDSERWQLDGICERGGLLEASNGRVSLMDPSTCTFWCAVALGALVRGSPLQSVASYIQLATQALENSYPDSAEADIAKALAILAHLHGFMGEQAKFQEGLVRAESFYSASIKKGSTDMVPVGFAELIKTRGDALLLEGVESSGTRELRPPQLKGAASEPEMYQYVMQSFHVFGAATVSKLVQSGTDGGSSGCADPAGKGAGGPSGPQHLSDAMVSVWGTTQFGPLEETVNRTLAMEPASAGDVHGTLERIGRCVDVFERYPGLCRSVQGRHAAHAVLAALSGLDASGTREAYDRMRASYNSCHGRDFLPVPPLEEWRGVSFICKGRSCRASERLFASKHMKAFSIPLNDGRPKEGRGVDGETVCLARELNEVVVSASAASSLRPKCCLWGTGLNSHHRASKAVNVVLGGNNARCSVGGDATGWSEATLMMPGVLGEGVEGEGEGKDIDEADWLDVAHALLDSSYGSSGGC